MNSQGYHDLYLCLLSSTIWYHTVSETREGEEEEEEEEERRVAKALHSSDTN